MPDASLTIAPPATPLSVVGSVADAAAAIARYLTPKEIENVSQDYETAAQKSLVEFQDIMSQPDSISRAQRLSAFLIGLCLECKQPTGSLSGIYIPIALEVVQAFGKIGIDDVRANKYNAGSLRALANK